MAGRLDMDPVGVVLFGTALMLVLLPFLFTTGSPSDDPRRWWLLVGSVLMVAVFIAWDRRYASRGGQPLLPTGIFRIGSFRNGVLVLSAYLAAVPTTFLLGTLYLQGGLGLAPVFAGMVTIEFAVASAFSSWLGGNLVNRLGRPLVVWGLRA